MPQVKPYKVTHDGGLLLHADYLKVSADSGMQVPQVDTTYGAGFGDVITDQARAFTASREPIGHFLTYIVAADMIDNWFTIDDPDTEEADPALDRTIQSALNKVHAKKYLRKAVESARTYGRSLLVGAFNDAKTIQDLAKPRALNAQLMQLAVYPETWHEWKVKEFTVYTVDNNPLSSRYGQPVIYQLIRQNLNESGQATTDNIYVHYTRVCEVGDGTSVLDKVWDDMSCGRNIRWGAAQWMYRNGSGFPVISFPANTSAEQLEAWGASGAFSNIMSRTYIAIAQNSTQENNGMTFEFKGPSGQSMDPTPFYVQNIQQIAIATGYPQAKLIGAQAGAVTGSEVNQQEYYKAIARDQEFYCEEPIRWLLSCLVDGGQISMLKAATDNNHEFTFKQKLKRLIKHDYRHKTVSDYTITWNSAFELSEKDQAQIELQHTQANVNKLEYLTIDEVRAEEEKDPLPNGEGDKLKGTGSSGMAGQEFIVKTNQQMRQPQNAANPELAQEPVSNSGASSSSSN